MASFDEGIGVDGDFTFIKLLGRGAFGAAYLYRHAEDGALVVLKEFDLAGLTSTRDAATGKGRRRRQCVHCGCC